MPKLKEIHKEFMTFTEWLNYLDRLIQAKTDMSMNDFQDCCYRDWFDDGLNVWEAYQAFREEVVEDDPMWAEVI